MKVGILYIAIGIYTDFWNDFYQSSEKYFLPDVEKEYYVFSDKDVFHGNNIHFYHQEDLGWPGNTLHRFKMFLGPMDDFSCCDYLFFFNANVLFKSPVLPQEILPSETENYFTALSWHPFRIKHSDQYPYDRNSKSAAYILQGEGAYYFQGGLNGGRKTEYCAFIKECAAAVEQDLSNGICARVNDESYLNKYLLNRQVKVLDTTYGKPEEWFFPFKAKIIFRDKNKFLGIANIRDLKNIRIKKQPMVIRFFIELSKYVRYLWKSK